MAGRGAYSEDDGFGGYAKGFAGLHQHMEKLQKAMAARLDELEERLCNEQPPLITVMDSQRYRGGDVPMEGEDPPDDWEKSRRSVKQAYRNQLDGRASVVSSRRGRTSVVSSSRLSTDSILEDYFRRGSLVWEATKAQRKARPRWLHPKVMRNKARKQTDCSKHLKGDKIWQATCLR
eukprot:Skav232567  [mRNA]  locus=scaffold1594:60198:72425:+ [translate_table: standard]